MDNKLIITKPDNFVFVDVTDQAEVLFNQTNLELFSWDGVTESLVDTVYHIRRAIKRGERIVIEGGHLPAKREVKWGDVDKVLIDGYWYVKYSNLFA